MKTSFGFDGLSPADFTNPVITIGTFDGVHAGHKAVLRLARERASAVRGESVVVTFDLHPREVIFGTRPCPITNLHQKLGLLAAEGMDNCAVLRFNRETSELTAREFLVMLESASGIREIVVGPDTGFGRNREGDLKFLEANQAEFGFSVAAADPVLFEGLPVSSSRIRELVLSDDLNRASAMLGRRFSICGTVIRGEGRGRHLGFPTANIDSHGQVLPPRGVWATFFKHGGKTLPSVTSIGNRPTFGDSLPVTVETFVFDFDGNLYGSDVELLPVKKIRDEIRFRSEDSLVQAMTKDAVKARAVLGKHANAMPA